MVDLFLMAEETVKRFCGSGGRPEVHGKIVACGAYAFGDLPGDGCSCSKSFFRFSDFPFFSGRNDAGMIVVSSAKCEVGRESEMVDPMGMCC